MAVSTYFERRGIRNALATYLTSLGWTNITYEEGFMSQATIETPLVTIEIVQPRKGTLELGNQTKIYKRNIQIDCYMESEPRAMGITDAIMEFIELTPVQIVDQASTNLGTIICFDNDTIYADILPPVLVDPKVRRWRGIVKSAWEAQYIS